MAPTEPIIEYSYHAMERMAQRGITQVDVSAALRTGRGRPAKNNLRIVEHEIEDGQLLRVIFDEIGTGYTRRIRVITAIRLGSSR